MSEMASWFKTKDGYMFLTDEDVIAYYENRDCSTSSINWNDFVGHSGLMTVFKLPNEYYHHEGFVNMPDVIKKAALNGKMDKIFSHAGNLREATPDFIPMMKRLAQRSKHVREQLDRNPYKNYLNAVSNKDQMRIGIENNFDGSTIGNLLRDDNCDEASMLLALSRATGFMDSHSDHHHYLNIIQHQNVTKKVLTYILDNIKHSNVQKWANERIGSLKSRRNLFVTRQNRLKKKLDVLNTLKVKTIKKGSAKVRMAVA